MLDIYLQHLTSDELQEYKEKLIKHNRKRDVFCYSLLAITMFVIIALVFLLE